MAFCVALKRIKKKVLNSLRCAFLLLSIFSFFFGWTLQHSRKINVSQASSHSEALQSPFNKNISHQMNLRFLLIFSSLHHICVPKTHPNAQSTPPMKAIFQYHHLGLCWPFFRTSWKFHNEKTSTHHGYMQKRHLDDLKPLQKRWNVLGICILFYMTLCFLGKSLHPFFSRHLFFSQCPLERFSNVGKKRWETKNMTPNESRLKSWYFKRKVFFQRLFSRDMLVFMGLTWLFPDLEIISNPSIHSLTHFGILVGRMLSADPIQLW